MKMLSVDRFSRIWRQSTDSPRRATIARYVLSVGFVGSLFAIIPHTPLEGPVAGVLALSSTVICCWFSGIGPSLLMPFTVWFVSRFPFTDDRPIIPAPQELLTFIGLSMLTGSVGLAGQFQQKLRNATRAHHVVMREQAKALSLARIVFCDADGRITTWSEGAKQLYGWSSEEAQGQFIHELLQTQFPLPRQTVRQVLDDEGQWRGEVIQTAKDGQTLHIEVHCILYSRDGDNQKAIAEVHSDVTALRRAEAAITESDRRKDVFVATLAHELRNPLAPLRNGIEILRLACDGNSENGEILQVMTRQLDHIVRMVDDLLDVSRIKTGKVELRRSQVKLGDIVRDALAACRAEIEAARHQLTVMLPNSDVFLHADHARVVQILMNLLSNAVKFTDPGGVIRLSAVVEDQNVTIRVADNGRGIPLESQPHIFETFVQVNHPLGPSGSGLGLGLNIVRTFVQLHGGTITVHSPGPEGGTEFVLRLPLLSEATIPTSPAEQAAADPTAEAAPQRVLIVDDNQDAATTLAMLLDSVGFTCRAVYDGRSALASVDEFAPQAVVLDLGMPGMSGLEVAQQLRAQPRYARLQLIALTGWNTERDRLTSAEAGFDHHLAKPVSIEQLMTLLKDTAPAKSREPTSRSTSAGETNHRAPTYGRTVTAEPADKMQETS